MNRTVIANEVKQSMTSECMDRRATLAMTIQGRCAMSVGFGQLAMTKYGFFPNASRARIVTIELLEY